MLNPFAMLYNRLSFWGTIISSVGILLGTLIKLNYSSSDASYAFIISLALSVGAFVFYMVSIFKESKKNRLGWALFGVIFPGISNVLYYLVANERNEG